MAEGNTIESYIFGGGSHLSEIATGGGSGVDDFVRFRMLEGYEVMMVIFAALYLIYIGRTLTNRSGVSFKVSNPFAPIVEAEGLGGSLRIGDLLLDWSMVVITVVLFTSRLVDITAPYSGVVDRLEDKILEVGVVAWMVGVGLTFVLTLIYGIVNTMIMTSLLRRNSVFRGFMLVKSRLLHIVVVWVFPVLLLSSMESENLFFTYVAIFQAVVFSCIYLFRSLLLFTAQKISILHWILYLCAVEIFPFTFLWALFVR